MRVALVQVASPPGEPPAERRERVGAMMAQARGAGLVVPPELWAAGYFIVAAATVATFGVTIAVCTLAATLFFNSPKAHAPES
ncbi:hypothetical protein [Actinomadura sp. 3N407]|uniref:hypothetical protein n=1 Tax=Actinomadura sp. 3N407 TaxID=3457423 RepID=UPI003FCE5C68